MFYTAEFVIEHCEAFTGAKRALTGVSEVLGVLSSLTGEFKAWISEGYTMLKKNLLVKFYFRSVDRNTGILLKILKF